MTPDTLSTKVSPRAAFIDAKVKEQAARKDHGGPLIRPPQDELRDLAKPEVFPWELVVIADLAARPELLDASSGNFLSGRVHGTAFLYPYVEGAVICAAKVDATSSSKLERRAGAEEVLNADVENEAMRSAIANMVKAGSRLKK